MTTRQILPSLSLVALLSCTGDGPTPPGDVEDLVARVSVSVTTSGTDTDPDGYTVSLGSRSIIVGPQGTVAFDDVPGGEHVVRLSGVAENCTVLDGPERTARVVTAGGAQVSFGVRCDPMFGDSFATVPCTELTTEAASAVPLDSVRLGRLPASLEPPVLARVVATDGDATGYTRVIVDGALEAVLVAPFHPGDLGGGTVTVRVTDGTRACAPLDWTVEPLPPASGATARVVELLQEIVDRQAAQLESSREELVDAQVGDLPQALIPLAAVQRAISHPDNENSLAAIAARTGTMATEADLAVVDRTLDVIGVEAALEAALGALPGAPERLPGPAGVGTRLCTPDAIGNDTGLLDACMDAQASAVFELNGASGEYLGDLAEVTEVLGFAGGVVGAGASVTGLVAWTALNVKERTAGLLPGRLVSLTYDASPTDFEEDRPGPGSWHDAQLTAASEGWDLGKEALEAILNTRGAGSSLGTKFDDLIERDPTKIIEDVVKTAGLEALLDQGTPLQIEPETFGPVSIRPDRWSEATMHGSAAQLVGHDEFEPLEPGLALLSVRTEDGEFGGRQLAEQKEITVRELSLTIEPDTVFVEADDVVSFVVTVHDSYRPDSVDIRRSIPLQGMAEITYRGEGSDTHDVLYVAPPEPDFDEDDELTLYHTAVGGARQYGPEREAVAVIKFGDVTIEPESGCLVAGDTLAFTAEVEGPEDQRVHWSVDVGEIDEDGVYRAPDPIPSGVQTATIRAKSVARPRLAEEVTIQLGGCECGWSVTLDGETFEGGPGGSITFQETVPGGDFELLAGIRLNTADGQVLHISAEEGGTEPVGGPASYDAKIAGNIGTEVSSPFMGYGTRYPGPYVGDMPEWAVARATLLEYEIATTLSGFVVGRVVLHENEVSLDEAPRVDFAATFHVTIPADYSETLRFYRTFTCEIPGGG